MKYIWNPYLYCSCKWKWRVIIAVTFFQFNCNCKEEAWKISGLQWDLNLWALRYRAMLDQLSCEATHWERGQFFELIGSKVKSYAELEPVKQKKLCLERFCHIALMLKTKRKTAKTWYYCITCSQKKKVKEGQDYICCVWYLVNYHINWKKLFFPCVSQSTLFLLLLAQTWRKAHLKPCKENS